MGEYKVGQWVTLVKHRVNSKYGASDLIGTTRQIQKINESLTWGLGVSMNPCGNWYYEDIRPATDAEIRAQGGIPEGKSGVKRKLSEITGKAVVHCKTQQEANTFCKLLMQLPEYKGQNADQWADYWDVYRVNHCYEIGKGSGYADVSYFKEKGYTIYPASDFIDTGVSSVEYHGPAINFIDTGVQSNKIDWKGNQQPVMVTEDNWYVGMRVVPSKTWYWGEADKFTVGTIVSNGGNHLIVNWDNHHQGWSCWIGNDGNHQPDLYIHQEQTSNYSQTNIKQQTNGKTTEYSGISILSTVKVQITGSAPIRGTSIGSSTKASAITSRPLSYTAIHSS